MVEATLYLADAFSDYRFAFAKMLCSAGRELPKTIRFSNPSMIKWTPA
jgi:hypothetical protein